MTRAFRPSTLEFAGVCPLRQSIAVAGAWGYIGSHFLRAAQSLGLQCFAFDPGPVPAGLEGVSHIASESDFYALKAGVFHLAIHPEHRSRAMQTLLARSRHEPIFILCEKPMAPPERPDLCATICEEVERSPAIVLYDFPELYDPIFRRIVEFLRSFDRVQIDAIRMERSKDRENPSNPRNYKRMVSIQYQESVHCLAFALHLLGSLSGDPSSPLADGVALEGNSKPYQPPNPEQYPHVVDGYCGFRGDIGSTRLEGCTNFLRGAPWSKRRVLRGTGDGKAFLVEADFLENEKRLVINGEPQTDVVHTNSYEEVITTCIGYRRDFSPTTLNHGVYPNSRFTRLTYQLSSALWRSCHDQRRIELSSHDAILAFDADFAAAARSLPRYD